jgi:plastocyanin domain-containing protein
MRALLMTSMIAFALAGCDKKPEGPAAPEKPVAASAKVDVKGKAIADPPKAGGVTSIAIAVGADGFAPSEVKLEKGEDATLVFTRTSDKTCAKEVEFPELKLKKDLPLNQPVAVIVPSGEARTITFQCGMGMYKSKVIVQ